MRSRPTHERGRIGLIRKGTGLVVATAELAGCLPPLDPTGFAANRHRHGIPAAMDQDVLAAGWVHPWVLRDIRPLAQPVVAGQKSGAVTWVTLSAAAAAALGDVTPPGQAVAPGPAARRAAVVTPGVAAAPAAPRREVGANATLAALHEALCRHPRLRHISDTKYIASFLTTEGHALALDLSAGREQPIWVEAHRVPRGALAEMEQVGYGPERGRNSNLHKLPGFRDGALIRFKPKTVADGLRIVDAITPT